MTQAPSPLSVGSLAQLTLSLLAIVALIFAISWVLKRFKVALPRSSGDMAVLEQVAIGPRERIALVRVGNAQVLVGVGAGGIVALTPLTTPIALSGAASTPAFAERLRDIMKRPGAAAPDASAPDARRVGVRAVVAMRLLLRIRQLLTRRHLWVAAWALLLPLALLPLHMAGAQAALPAVAIKSASDGVQTYSLTFQILVLMTALTFLPAILLAMTAFTRIIIVLSILRQALGMSTTPSNQVLTGLALFMTFFVMSSTLEQAYGAGIKPYMDGQLAGELAIERTMQPLKKFMLAQTRENDLQMFAKMSGKTQFESADAVPLSVLIPTFITSELKTAFQIGFMIFIPFLVIDLVVASVLMSMGMMMLSPVLVSLPFKIMLFVVVDGWTLLVGTLAASFHV